MASAAGKLERELAGVALRVPAVPVVANVTGQPHTGPDEIRRTMVRQVTSPVQWVADMQWFQKAGVAEYVECGPGRVLAGLIKRIDKDSVVHSIHDRPALERAVTAMRD
jgi:[acyl-carrier-protein] S-malonyltransferase